LKIGADLLISKGKGKFYITKIKFKSKVAVKRELQTFTANVLMAKLRHRLSNARKHPREPAQLSS
jgi:threonyl-tRNA synthetase